MHNAVPAFCKSGTLGTPVVPSAANTKSDGAGTIGTDIFLFLTADATNGTYVEDVQLTPQASAAGTATTATVARIFASSQAAGATTTANTHLLAEVALPSVTADSATVANNPIVVPIGKRLPAGWTLLVTNHAAPAASTGWKTMATAGDY